MKTRQRYTDIKKMVLRIGHHKKDAKKYGNVVIRTHRGDNSAYSSI